MKKVIGYYCNYQYEVTIDGETLYAAGNSPGCSQTYTTKENGLPLETMKKFCEQTSREMAKENNTEFIGVEFDESTEEEMDALTTKYSIKV